MTIRSCFSVLVFAVLLASAAPIGRAAEGDATAPSDTNPVPAETRFERLDQLMDRLGQLARQLRRELPNPANNANSLAAAKEIGALFEAAHAGAEANNPAMLPTHLRNLPEADRPAFIEDYKEALLAIRAKVAELEANLTAGDNAAAQVTFAAVLEMRNVAHDRFDPQPPRP